MIYIFLDKVGKELGHVVENIDTPFLAAFL